MYLNKWKVIDFKMADISLFIKKYSKYQTTFKVTSYDDKNKVGFTKKSNIFNYLVYTYNSSVLYSL